LKETFIDQQSIYAKLLQIMWETPVTHNKTIFSHPQLKSKISHVAIGSVMVIVAIILHVQFNPKLALPALAAIIFFNLLFLFLLFPLEGPFFHKVMLLLAGNIVGGLWYFVQFLFRNSIMLLNTESVKIAFWVVQPFVDLLWVVAVWSFSLSVLVSHKRKLEMLQTC
jgi:hypothetical protein